MVEPAIKPGVDGFAFTSARLLALLAPQLSLDALTVKLLLVKPLVKLTFTVVSFTPVPFGCVIVVVPACAVQMYDVAFGTDGMVYVNVAGVPMIGHTLVGPVIDCGVPGACATST